MCQAGSDRSVAFHLLLTLRFAGVAVRNSRGPLPRRDRPNSERTSNGRAKRCLPMRDRHSYNHARREFTDALP